MKNILINEHCLLEEMANLIKGSKKQNYIRKAMISIASVRVNLIEVDGEIPKRLMKTIKKYVTNYDDFIETRDEDVSDEDNTVNNASDEDNGVSDVPDEDSVENNATDEDNGVNDESNNNKISNIKKWIIVCFGILVIVFMIIGVVACNGNIKKQTIEVPTQGVTQKVTEKPTNRPTEKPTQKPTQKSTEKPTQKPTQKQAQQKNTSNNQDNVTGYSSNGSVNSYEPQQYDNNTYNQQYDDNTYNQQANENAGFEEIPDDDMSQEKDSSEDQGITGGNEGYGASISNTVESPVPETKFEEEHPLPPAVTPDEIADAPVASLTPAN